MERRLGVKDVCGEERWALGGVGCSKLSGLLEKGRGDMEVEEDDDSEVSGRIGK